MDIRSFSQRLLQLVTNPHTFKSLPYDPLRDFAPVSMIAKGPVFPYGASRCRRLP